MSDRATEVAIMDRPAPAAPCVVLDEFLAPQELAELMSFVAEHETEFQTSEVIAAKEEAGVIDYHHRRSRVLMNLGNHERVMLERIRHVLPAVREQLGMEEFAVQKFEAQITASNDGDFFGVHSDDSQELVASRRLTFVYFFHREPRAFTGGELRLYAGNTEGSSSYQKIVPQQNQIAFFPCSAWHEITAVECPSKAFADSRFTLNGWLHK